MTEREPLYTVNDILESLPDYAFRLSKKISYAEMYGASLVFQSEEGYHYLPAYLDKRPAKAFTNQNRLRYGDEPVVQVAPLLDGSEYNPGDVSE
jgi:hypothetical protein